MSRILGKSFRPYFLTSPWTVFVLLALYWTMAVSAVRNKSNVFDEISHLTAGYSYLETGDFRLHPGTEILPQEWAALPLVFESVRFPSLHQPAWWNSDDWSMGSQFFYQEGNDVDSMLWRGRAMIAILGACLGLLVYLWAKQLFGQIGALISLFLFAFCPSLLAHGSLITSDMASALFLSLSLWWLWKLLHRVTPLTILGCSGSFAALVLTKITAVLLLPLTVILVCIRLGFKEPLTVSLRYTRQLEGIKSKLTAFVGAATVIVAILLLFLWSAYGFRYSAFREIQTGRDQFVEPWEAVLMHTGSIGPALRFARDHRVLPEDYLYGLAYRIKSIESRRAFLNGQYGITGWWYFFLYCLLVKSPLPLFAVLLLAGLAAMKKWRHSFPAMAGDLYRAAPLLSLLAVYWILSITSKTNIGHRHILPTYPPMLILAGASAYWIQNRQRIMSLFLVACLFLFAFESLRIRPHYLAYFNQLAGGPKNAYRHLVDSSLDWGQDLPGLKQWLQQDQQKVGNESSVYFSYFGTADPQYYGINAVRLPGYANRQTLQDKLRPVTGGIYCISATMLQSIYSWAMGPWAAPYENTYQQLVAEVKQRTVSGLDPQKLDFYQQLRFARLCTYLRHREPDDQVGYSILIYRLTDQEVYQALWRPPAELQPKIDVRGLQN